MASVRDTHRISMSSDEIDELAMHLGTLKQQINLSKNLSNIHAKLVINQTKVNLGVKQADYKQTGNGNKSAASKLLEIDPETYLLEYGNPEEQAAVDAAITHYAITEELKSWQEFMPAIGDRKYPSTEIPGTATL